MGVECLNLPPPLVISANMSILFILHVLILFCATEIHASLPRFVFIAILHLFITQVNCIFKAAVHTFLKIYGFTYLLKLALCCDNDGCF